VDYMAPEQAQDAKNVDLRADIYSLGCTLWFLATGRPPAPDGSLTKKLLWHQTHEAPALSSVVSASTSRLDGVLKKMLAKKPEERYTSMREVAKELEKCLAELPRADKPLSDGFDLVGEHGTMTHTGTQDGQATIVGGVGDTIVTKKRNRGLPPLPTPNQE